LLCNSLVQHPNVVQLLGYTLKKLTGEKVLFVLFMEACKIHTLEDELKEVWGDKEPSDEKAIWIVETLLQLMAAGVAFEDKKVMHRDLKPANILYDDGVVKVADFGLARSAEEDEAATMLAGAKI